MPRKAYLADLNELSNATNIHGISHLRAGEETGDFSFRITTNPFGSYVEVSATVFPDLSEYPSGHTFTFSDDTPSHVTETLSVDLIGKTLAQLLELASRAFVTWDKDGDTPMPDSQPSQAAGRSWRTSDCSDNEEHPGQESDDTADEDDFDFGEHPSVGYSTGDGSSRSNPLAATAAGVPDRVRSDLEAVKDAGFKVGYHGDIRNGSSCYVSISCRMSKLGISNEAMQAWQVKPSEYLILLIHYPQGYRSVDSLIVHGRHVNRQSIQFRIAASHTYKPTLSEARHAFAVLTHKEVADEAARKAQAGGIATGFHGVFISRPLNDLLNERLLALVSFRLDSMSWSGAEEFYNDIQGRPDAFKGSTFLNDRSTQEHDTSKARPKLLTADHFRDSPSAHTLSFPLVAMQFLLRHFVRCTEFCLVCHRKLDNDFEAIKPYVCDKSLCLYQYMSLGFGPSIEHEIITQPYVVDLLISFCYTSARDGHLKDFPQGLSLLVPPMWASLGASTSTRGQSVGSHVTTVATSAPLQPATQYEAKFDRSKFELLFDRGSKCPVREGDWLAIWYPKSPKDLQQVHCRVTETTFFPSVRVSKPINYELLRSSQDNSAAKPTESFKNRAATPDGSPDWIRATFYVWTENFDGLDVVSKRSTIVNLLDILPSVKEMRDYLSHKSNASLASWTNRIPAATLGLLRWIIASSRACIMQVDDWDTSLGASAGKPTSREERLYGMKGWMQFRFAMGAPDKERRFINAVRDTTARLNLMYPTLFAWHGSPLYNWHSIIREGLNFNQTSHGRAFGHGCYHSLEYNVSAGYTNSYRSHSPDPSWPQSELRINAALALNEIVNAPQEFVSHSPHLVVAQLDWIQTRYLFVQCTGDLKPGTDAAPPAECHEQDPHMTPSGVDHSALIIPLTAVARARQRSPHAVRKGKNKKLKATGSADNPISFDDEDDSGSVPTDEEDLTIFLSDEDGSASPELQHKKSASTKSMTDFVPGTLDQSTLPVLAPPLWATPGATKRLQTDFRSVIKIQSSQPLHELGWYINPEHFTNVYQWIVELHSFEPHLPLAQDMKARGVKSIVLEMRFGKDYPMSPPFVRVIRPRFLGFQQGGGGHVTAGGALCMELLTNNGWSAVSSIESVLLQVRMAISSTEPKPARLENGAVRDYGVGEAVDAYIRACNAHGWTVPPGFKEMAYGGNPDAY